MTGIAKSRNLRPRCFGGTVLAVALFWGSAGGGWTPALAWAETASSGAAGIATDPRPDDVAVQSNTAANVEVPQSDDDAVKSNASDDLGAGNLDCNEIASRASKPWDKGFSMVGKKRACELFKEGTNLFRVPDWKEAIKRYREALNFWDHPAIHYNLALALEKNNEPLEQRKELLKATSKYGADGLGKGHFLEAKSALAKVERELAKYEIHCGEANARVTLDGKPLFVGAGSYTDYASPGQHVLQATKNGFNSKVHTFNLAANTFTRVELPVYRKGLVRYEREVPLWVPLVVTGAGGVLLITGAIFDTRGRRNVEAYDEEVTRKCSTGGCDGSTVNEDQKDRGELYQEVGVGALVAGGAAFAGGLVLLFVSKADPKPIEPKLGVKVQSAFLTPVLGPSTAGVVGGGRF